MTKVVDQFVVCDQCGGAIPDGADRIQGVNGTLILGGQSTPFLALDFCCSEHMATWVQAHPQVPTPNPPYPTPPAPT